MRAEQHAARDALARRALPSVAGVAALGLLPLAFTREPTALIVWFALAAPAAGVLAGSARLPVWPYLPCVPALWMVALALASGVSERVLASPAWAACVWTGLYCAGAGLGRAVGEKSVQVAALALLAVGAWVALPIGAAWSAAPFGPETTARLLALSPLTWVLDAAGVDWLHHPAFYERARTFDFGPELVRPLRPALAGGAALLLGCALLLAGSLLSRARRAQVPERAA
ncbi:MAG: hypothetical protein HZA53_00265 [Planctomycetes bacterium]|nr:hypothetical protein [Planctomycetota bacterium]